MADFPTVADIQAEAERFLRAVLDRYHQAHPQRVFSGLACECDPGAGSCYVYLRDQDETTEESQMWKHNYIEQEVGAVDPPTWFAPYDELQTAYFQEERIEYAEIAAALERILAGVSKAISQLQATGFLAEHGFREPLCLSVFTEDDEDLQQGQSRVRQEEP